MVERLLVPLPGVNQHVRRLAGILYNCLGGSLVLKRVLAVIEVQLVAEGLGGQGLQRGPKQPKQSHLGIGT